MNSAQKCITRHEVSLIQLLAPQETVHDLNKYEKKVFDLVRKELKDEYVPEEYRGKVNSSYCGHCHHATIALYNLLGGKENGYKVRKAVDELGIKHYWLENKDGEIIDPTGEQYTDLDRTPPYANKVNRGVSYRRTKAANEIIDNVNSKLHQG